MRFKKIFSLALVLIMFLSLTGCKAKLLSPQKSEENFKHYEKQLSEILEKYNLTFELEPFNGYPWAAYKDCLIFLDKTSENSTKIMVSFSNTRGLEYFNVWYISYEEKTSNFNLTLFTEIVNTFSGMEISEDYCKQFLSDLENKEEKSEIFEYDNFGFFEEWSLSYQFSPEYPPCEELRFDGLTKRGTSGEGLTVSDFS